jgi:2-polyprenyl-3-methyl-5-hydroxy-6-metoxy-1,4-benzoquinol methylase
MQGQTDGLDMEVHDTRGRMAVRNILGLFGLNVVNSFLPGLAFFGVHVFRERRPGPMRPRSSYALDHALKLAPKSVLDVGSGGGFHARAFAEAGSEVLCVDYGTSVYARHGQRDGLTVVNVDFNAFHSEKKFDLIWASHILEHQRNVGVFLEKLIDCCSEDGTIAITVPDPHRKLAGGHVTLWTPGLLAYNVALCGVDISDARFIRGTHEFSIFFKRRKVPLPDDLTYDYGDLDKLAKYLPQGMKEESDAWDARYDV